jgi:Domain of unknown function (DUF1772)
MLEVAQFLATLCCTLFAGAAVYINLVEHPARMGCDTKTAATVWAPSYKRATLVQASLAIVSFLAGALAWLLGGGILWLVGAVLIGLVVPFTFIAIIPTNHQLLAPGKCCVRSDGHCTIGAACDTPRGARGRASDAVVAKRVGRHHFGRPECLDVEARSHADPIERTWNQHA